MAAVVKEGDRVRIHYTGTLSDGREFDSSRGREPLEFTVGAGELIPGFERAVLGMHVGEKKVVTVAAEEAYGPYRPELVVEVPREQLPATLEPQVDQAVQIATPEGEVLPAVITAVSTASIELDANHPLAGEYLTFELEAVEIVG